MKNFIVCCSCFCLLACNNVSVEVNKAQEKTDMPIPIFQEESILDLELIQSEKETILAEMDAGMIQYYTVLDGWGRMAESTTYFSDEAKSKPCKTKIIYLDGGSSNIYWLANNYLWFEGQNQTHLYKNGILIKSFQDDASIELSDQDRLEAAKLVATPLEILSKLMH